MSHSCATSRLEPWTDTHTHRTEGCDTSGNLVRSGRNQLEIIGNQLEITEIWLEIRNQDPVEIRKSARNHKKSSRNNEKHPLFCLSMRSRPFAHAHLRNPREIRVTKAGNQLEISWKSVGNHSEGGKSVGNHRNPEISYAEKARVVPLAQDNYSNPRACAPRVNYRNPRCACAPRVNKIAIVTLTIES